MPTAYVFLPVGQSNADGYGLAVADMLSSYRGHNLQSSGDPIFDGRVKIYNWNTGSYQALSLDTTQEADDSHIGIGAHLYAAVHLAERYPAGDIYIIKTTPGGTALQQNGANNWSVEDYGTARSMLKVFADRAEAGVNLLLATSYDTVNVVGIYDVQGESDADRADFAYRFYHNKHNFLARIAETLGYSAPTAPRPFHGLVCPVMNGIYVTLGTNALYQWYHGLHRVVRKAIINVAREKALAYGSKSYQYIDGSDWDGYIGHLQDDEVHGNGMWHSAMADRWFSKFDEVGAAPVRWPGVRVNTFAALPTLSVVTAPSSYGTLGASFTATVSWSGIDLGDTGSNIRWADMWDPSVKGSGASITTTPKRAWGHTLQATYINAKGYAAGRVWNIALPPPTTAVGAAGVPKHLVNMGIGATVTSGYGAVTNLPMFTGASSGYTFGVQAGTPKLLHNGLAMVRGDAYRARSGTTNTTASYQAAALVESGDQTRIVRVQLHWPNAVAGRIYGSGRATTNNGVDLRLSPATPVNSQGRESVFEIGPWYKTSTITKVASGAATGPTLPNSGNWQWENPRTIVAALRKTSAGVWTMHTWDEVNSTTAVGSSATWVTSNQGYPDAIGESSWYGNEMTVQYVAGFESALSDGQIASILAQLSVEAATTTPGGSGDLVTGEISAQGTATFTEGSQPQGSGALSTLAATLAGTATATATRNGNGALSTQAATLAATGSVRVNGTGALSTQAATLAGMGTAASADAPTGSGALATQAATVSGVAAIIYNGVGALIAQPIGIAGEAAPQSAFSVTSISVPDALPEDNLDGEICFRWLRTVFTGAGFGTAQGTVLISDGTHSAYATIYQWTDTLIEFTTTTSLAGYPVMPGPVSVTIRRADGVSITFSATMGLRDSYTRLVTIDSAGTAAPYWGDLAVGDPVFYTFNAQLVVDLGAGTTDPNVVYPVVLSPDRHVSIAAGTPAGVYRVPYFVYRAGAWEPAVLNYIALSAVIVMAGTSGDYTIPDYSGLTEVTGWTMQEGAPAWVTVSAAGVITASPSLTQLPGQYEVTVEAVEASTGATVTQVVVVAVTANPDAATLIDIDTDRIRLRVF